MVKIQFELWKHSSPEPIVYCGTKHVWEYIDGYNSFENKKVHICEIIFLLLLNLMIIGRKKLLCPEEEWVKKKNYNKLLKYNIHGVYNLFCFETLV